MGTDAEDDDVVDRTEELLYKAQEGEDVTTFISPCNPEIKGSRVTVIPLEPANHCFWGGDCGEYKSEDLVYMTRHGVEQNDKTATVFIAPRLIESGEEEEKTFFIRWFSPKGSELVASEHGNLGAAHYLYVRLRLTGNIFFIGGNPLRTMEMTRGIGGVIAMELTTHTTTECNILGDDNSGNSGDPYKQPLTRELVDSLGLSGHVSWAGEHHVGIVLCTSMEKLIEIEPDFENVKSLSVFDKSCGSKQPKNIHVAAFDYDDGPYDFQYRCFSPNLNINEDQVTTSACSILGELRATHWYKDQPSGGNGYYCCRQCSTTQAEFLVRFLGNNKVSLAGRACINNTGREQSRRPTLWMLLSAGLGLSCCANRTRGPPLQMAPAHIQM